MLNVINYIGVNIMLYDFECNDCKKKFDIVLIIKSFEQWKKKKNTVECPKCGKTNVKNNVSSSPVHLGKGFTRSSF